MNKGGVGMGSALIILVFVVLCLTIFALISLSSATADLALAESAVRTVMGYYEADTLAESIVAEIMEADLIPGEISGVEIMSGWEAGRELVMFSCPVSDTKELYVEIAVVGDTYDICQWRMQDSNSWEIMDMGIPVWLGD